MADHTEMSSNEARLKFREALDTARAGGHVHITRYGRSEAVMVPRGWYQQAVAAITELAQRTDD